MWKIAGDRDVPVIERVASCRSQAREQLSIAKGLSVIFIAGVM
jgi:hypothetical protein